jgi:hypothetical protein
MAQVPLIDYSIPPLPEPVAQTLTNNVGQLQVDVKALQEQAKALQNDIQNLRGTHLGWGSVSDKKLSVSPFMTDHPPYPQLDEDRYSCEEGYYVSGALNVNGTFAFRCRQVGIINK